MYIDPVFLCCFTSPSPLKPCLRDAQHELEGAVAVLSAALSGSDFPTSGA